MDTRTQNDCWSILEWSKYVAYIGLFISLKLQAFHRAILHYLEYNNYHLKLSQLDRILVDSCAFWAIFGLRPFVSSLSKDAEALITHTRKSLPWTWHLKPNKFLSRLYDIFALRLHQMTRSSGSASSRWQVWHSCSRWSLTGRQSHCSIGLSCYYLTSVETAVNESLT